jgi:hypothetical protein
LGGRAGRPAGWLARRRTAAALTDGGPQLEEPDDAGRSVVHVAAERGYVALLTLIVRMRVRLTAPDRQGKVRTLGRAPPLCR